MMPFGQFNAVVISVSQNCPLTKVITYQRIWLRSLTKYDADAKIGSTPDGFEPIFWGRYGMNALICDDEKQYMDALAKHVQEYMNNRYIDCSITTTTSPAEILHSDQRFDLAFLDIQMEEMDGIALAKVLRERNSRVALFFVTNYDEYQDDAMDLRAFRFFEKPFDVTRLYAGLDKAMEYIDGAYVDIYLYGDGAQQRVLADDILYVTRNNRKVILVTKDTAFNIAESFDALCAKLPPLFFYAVHKSFFVNLHYVDRYSYTELYLSDGTRIPIAPRKQSAFHRFWFEYLRRR